MPLGQLIRDDICRFLSPMPCLYLELPTSCLRPGKKAVELDIGHSWRLHMLLEGKVLEGNLACCAAGGGQPGVVARMGSTSGV